MALAEVLRDQGVTVTETEFLVDAGALLNPGDTLVLAHAPFFDFEQSQSLLGFDGNLVILGTANSLLFEIDNGVVPQTGDFRTNQVVEADCSVPAARNAGSIKAEGAHEILVEDTTGVDVCFGASGDPQAGIYVEITRENDTQIRILGDGNLITNERISEHGHAALALNAIGTVENVVWYVQNPFDIGTLEVEARDELLQGQLRSAYHPAAPAVIVGLGLVGIAALWWRGKRVGPLVTEPLPVVVRSSEVTRGRGALYRKFRSRGRATAGIRAGIASRCARSLGLPRTAQAEELVSAIAAATTRDEVAIRDAFYGPPPTTDAEMVDLVRTLDAIESEVHSA